MRTRQVVFAIILLGAALAMAGAQGGLSVKGGLSYGTASVNGLAPGATQRSGFVVGLGAASGGSIGFGIEALYAQRGYTSTNAADSRRLDYIDVPLYVRLSLPTPGISPFAYVGPQASYELQCGAGGTDCPDSGREKFTFAGVIGAGLRFPSLRRLSLEGRYVYGLSDLKLSTIQSSASYKTRSLLVLLGLGF